MNAPLKVDSDVLQVSELRVELAGQVEVLAEVSFSLAAGEIVGLVGESGSGKTTLATALLQHARQGARIVGGQVVVDFAPVPKRDRATLDQVLRAAFKGESAETSLIGWTTMAGWSATWPRTQPRR